MATIQKFEDLVVWQKARLLNTAIYSLTNNEFFNNDSGLQNQMRRASVSILSNIAKGFERNGNKEFNQFLSIAKASAAELRAQIYIATDIRYITEEESVKYLAMVIEVSKMLNGLMSYLQNTDIKGNKFMEEVAIYNRSYN